MLAIQIVCFAIAILVIGCVLYSSQSQLLSSVSFDPCTLENLGFGEQFPESIPTSTWKMVTNVSQVPSVYYFMNPSEEDGWWGKQFRLIGAKDDGELFSIAWGNFNYDGIIGEYCSSDATGVTWTGQNDGPEPVYARIQMKAGKSDAFSIIEQSGKIHEFTKIIAPPPDPCTIQALGLDEPVSSHHRVNCIWTMNDVVYGIQPESPKEFNLWKCDEWDAPIAKVTFNSADPVDDYCQSDEYGVTWFGSTVPELANISMKTDKSKKFKIYVKDEGKYMEFVNTY